MPPALGLSLLAVLLIGCSGRASRRQPDALAEIRTELGPKVTFKSLVAAQGTLLIAPELGGKIIGITTAGSAGGNLLFTHARLREPGFLAEKTSFFNPGGDRCWLAPSARFNFAADGTLRIPAAIDPGHYAVIESSATRVVMASRIQVTDDRGHAYDLELRREIELIGAPRLPGLEQIAFRCTNRLVNRSSKVIGRDLPLVSLKTFVEVAPPGEIHIALTRTAASNPAVAYLDPFPTERDRDTLTLRLDGGRDGLRQKLGLPPSAVTGRVAYVAPLGAGRSMALVRIFPVDPNGSYIENRDDARGKPGDALQIYDDNGRLGGFAEIEELGPVGPLAGGAELVHPVTVHALTGPDRELRAAVRELLGLR
jgi:hypothetical protein